MRRLALACSTLSLFAVVLSNGVAYADGAAAPPPTAVPPGTVMTAPPGSPGYTVVAPTSTGGSVIAAGCSQVIVDGRPSYVTPNGQPCPYAMTPYQPYYPPPPPASRYQRDPERTGALIVSSIGFGLGAFISGITYLVEYSKSCSNFYDSGTGTTVGTQCSNDTSKRNSLIAYGAIVSVTPSIPRFVVGDTTGGLVYSIARAASVTTAAFVHWGSDGDTNWQGPFLLGFAAPITLGIIDLATTPHREDLEPEKDTGGIKGLGPVAVTDPHGNVHGAILSLDGTF
jgi:hypothetical protein